MDSTIFKSLNVNGRLLDLSIPQVMVYSMLHPILFMQVAEAGQKPILLHVPVRYLMKGPL